MPRLLVLAGLLLASGAVSAQAPDGPLAPLPDLRPTWAPGALSPEASARGADQEIAPIGRWPYGFTRAVAFADGVGVTAEGSVIRTLDLSTPGAVGVLGEVVIEGVVSDMAAEGDLVAAMVTHFLPEETGLFVIDVSDPAAPRVRGSFTGIAATSVAVKDGIAYVGTYEAAAGPQFSLRLLSLSDPDLPQHLSTLETPSFPDDISVSDGGRAYLAMNVVGLGVADVRDVGAPTLGTPVSTLYTAAVSVGEVDGEPVLASVERVAAGEGVLRAYGLDDPDRPALLGEDDLRTNNIEFGPVPFDLVWDGDRVVIGAGYGGLQFADVDDPSAPNVRVRRPTSRAYVASAAGRIATDGNEFIVADLFSGTHRGDLPSRALTGLLPAAGVALGIEVDPASGAIYVADGSFGVAVLQRAAGARGEILALVDRAHTSDWNYTTALAQTNAYLYAADGFGGIWTVDKATFDPVHNVLRDSTIREVAVTDDGALLLASREACTTAGPGGAGCRVYVLSLADPAAPALVSTIVPPAGAADLAGTGPVAWIGDFSDTRLRIYDLTDPAAPVASGDVELLGSAFRFARDGDRLYALGNGVVASILDVSAPEAPVVLGDAQSVVRSEGLAARGGVLVMAGFGATSFDVRDPAATFETAFSEAFGDVQSGVAYISEGLVVMAVGHAGASLVATPVIVPNESPAPLARVRVSANPNPTRGALSLRIETLEAAEVAVFDALGRRVRVLARGLRGDATLAWDGRGESAAPLAPGVYVVRVRTASGEEATARVTLVR